MVDDAQKALPSEEEWCKRWRERHNHRSLAPLSSTSGGGAASEEVKKENGVAAVVSGVDVEEDEDGPEDGELAERAPPLITEKGKKPPPVMPETPRLLFIGLNNESLRLKTMSISLDGYVDSILQ